MPEENDDRGQTETQRLAEAIEIANIPVLLMMLVQLTGNLLWLDDNYRTRRARGMNDNDTGGHPEAIVAEIRAAALEAIVTWRAGRPSRFLNLLANCGSRC
jgi:4-hydroxyacetophenone monooxygenase